MVLAAVRGVVDFRQARLLDVTWWQRTNILLNGLARDLDGQLIDAAYRYHLALVANGQLTESSFKSAQKQSVSLYEDLLSVVKPWQADSSGKIKQQEHSKFRQMYKQLVGDLDDPAFRARLEEEVRRMLNEPDDGGESPGVVAPDGKEMAAGVVVFD